MEGLFEGIFGMVQQGQSFQQSQYDAKQADYFRQGRIGNQQNKDLIIFAIMFFVLIVLILIIKFL